MRAMTVEPGRKGSAAVTEVSGPVGSGDVSVEGVAVGICGTDRELASGEYGQAPEGSDRLVIGHESLGRVLTAPTDSGLTSGQLVVGLVRRPDPVPCPACGAGAMDMCINGRYTERGIKGLDGYGAGRWKVEAQFAVGVPAGLGDAAVLVEPASVVAKAWEQIERVVARAPISPRKVLVTGAGPIGLLAALLGAQRGLELHVLDRVDKGPKPDLVADLGATYHLDSLAEVPEPDIVIECTGAPSVIVDVLARTTPTGVVCLTGVSSGGRKLEIDIGATNRSIVLENDVILGTVSANISHYRQAIDALAAAADDWLAGILTRRVPLESWMEGLEMNDDDVKVVVDLTEK